MATRLLLRRSSDTHLPNGVYGSLAGDGALTWTLESAKHLIPAGTYRVILTESGRVHRKSLWSPEPPMLPELLEVPGRTAIRIHAGNVPSETIGCILVGESLNVDGSLARSRAALRRLWWVFRRDGAELEIRDPEEVPRAVLA